MTAIEPRPRQEGLPDRALARQAGERRMTTWSRHLAGVLVLLSVALVALGSFNFYMDLKDLITLSKVTGQGWIGAMLDFGALPAEAKSVYLSLATLTVAIVCLIVSTYFRMRGDRQRG